MQVWLTKFHAGNFAQKTGEEVKETYHFVNHNVRCAQPVRTSYTLTKKCLKRKLLLNQHGGCTKEWNIICCQHSYLLVHRVAWHGGMVVVG